MNKPLLLTCCLIISLLPKLNFAQQNIIGGISFDIKDAPYQVSITDIGRNHFCGGVIISETWVLTAAHCLNFKQPSDLLVFAGITDNTNHQVGQGTFIDSFRIHPGYSVATFGDPDFDIALLKLNTPLIFNYGVMPIEYSSMSNTNSLDLIPGVEAILTGWGDTSLTPGIQSPNLLRGVSLPLISEAASLAIHQSKGINSINLDSNKISFFSPGQSSGTGDSGGPATINKNGNVIAVGLTSFAYNPIDSVPSIYTNVITFSEWVDSVSGISNNPNRIDLYIKDKPWDMGQEPFQYDYPWTSDDIWIRNQNDTIEEHQDPEYSLGNNPNYVNVRITNNGALPSIGNEQLKVYWAKAATALAWPAHWNNSITVGGQSLGDSVGTVTLPVIQPGDAYIATLPWLPPNPADFAGLSGNPIFFANQPHHFCLLARIESTIDTMTVLEQPDVGYNTEQNNNIAWKNITVVNNNLTNLTGNATDDDVPNGATVIVGSIEEGIVSYDLEFGNVFEKYAEPITDYAEVRITLDDLAWNNWTAGGQLAENIQIIDAEDHKLMLTGASGKLKNISFDAQERGLVHTSFNFLTNEISAQNNFQFKLVQKKSIGENKIVGGELFEIRTPVRTNFDANAGQDEEVEEGDPITLNALQISENAIYNWYNQAGELIHTGSDFTVTPDITQTYTLEVIATADGFKDYDQIEVSVNEHSITSIAPNPVSTNLIVNYDAEGATSAYFVLVKLEGNQSNQFILNTTETNCTIDLSNFQSGNYSLILVCNGIVQDFENLIIQ